MSEIVDAFAAAWPDGSRPRKSDIRAIGAIVEAAIAAASTGSVATIADLKLLTGPTAGQIIFVRGYASAGDGGGGWFWYDNFDTTSADNLGTIIRAGATARWKRHLVGGVTSAAMFGAVNGGGASDSDALNAWMAHIAIVGGTHIWDPAIYLSDDQVVLNVPGVDAHNTRILAAGARIITEGAVSAFRISGRGTPFNQVVDGLTVVHAGNDGEATAGLEQVGTTNVTWENCVVLADNTVNADYGGWLLRNTDIADDGTACFWTRFPGSAVRSTGGVIVPIGVLLQGAANATSFHNFYAEGAIDAIKATTSGGTNSMANGVSIAESWFEGLTNVFRAVGVAGHAGVYGLTVQQTRVEDVSNAILKFEGATVDNQQPPYLGPGCVIVGVGALTDNAEGLVINHQVLWNGSGALAEPDILRNERGFVLANSDASYDALQARGPDGTGLAIAHLDGGVKAALRGLSGAGGVRVDVTAGTFCALDLEQVGGISQSTTKSNNLAGVSGALSSGHIDVAFATAEANANYRVSVTANASIAGRVWVSNKGTGGFRINSTDSGDTATFDWFKVQD